MMKQFILAGFFLFSLTTGRAQIFNTYLSTQEWAGGMCCRGIKYTLFITGNPAELEKLVVKAVCIDGKYFDQLEVSPVVTRNNLSGRTYIFNWRTDPDDHQSDNCTNNGRIYLEGKEFLMIESRYELPFIAYP